MTKGQHEAIKSLSKINSNIREMQFHIAIPSLSFIELSSSQSFEKTTNKMYITFFIGAEKATGRTRRKRKVFIIMPPFFTGFLMINWRKENYETLTLDFEYRFKNQKLYLIRPNGKRVEVTEFNQ